MQEMWSQISSMLGDYVPNLLGAIAILIVGWLVALIASAMVRGALRRTRLTERIRGLLGGSESKGKRAADTWVAKGVFYIIFLFAIVAFLQALGLPLATEPLNGLLTQLLGFAPKLVGAGVLVLVAWVVARIARVVISKALDAVRLDERVEGEIQGAETQKPLSRTLADAAYWLVFLLFLPAVLGALELDGILQPVQLLFNKVLGFMPNIVTAAILVLVGWFVARIVRRVVTNLLAGLGVDRVSERVGMSAMLGAQGLSGLIGLIVYVLILIPVLIAALDTLALEAVSAPASNMLNVILAAIPKIFSAALVIAVAYVIGRVACSLVTNVLKGIGFDNLLQRLGLGHGAADGGRAPSAVVGTLVMVAILLIATTESFAALGFEQIADLLAQFAVFAGHILVGLVIFGIGLVLANLASSTLRATRSSSAGFLAVAARIAILVFAGAMALRQMGLANEIINTAFGLTLGAMAVAAAIAFGIGGRDLAARTLEQGVDSLRAPKKGKSG